MPGTGYRQPEEIGIVDLVFIGLKTTANQYYQKLISPMIEPVYLPLLIIQNKSGEFSGGEPLPAI